MAFQALHGLVREKCRSDLIGAAASKGANQAEIEALVALVAATRLKLIRARDSAQIAEMLGQIYRCEDRIKVINRLHRPAQRHPARLNAQAL